MRRWATRRVCCIREATTRQRRMMRIGEAVAAAGAAVEAGYRLINILVSVSLNNINFFKLHYKFCSIMENVVEIFFFYRSREKLQ